jgi:L-alanine-DL-glutamate epimerase-like enolase superfamily enzyme
MRITKIHQDVVSLRSEISNAFISFEHMTASIVAIHTDVVRDAKKVIGYGFNSNGRYAQPGVLADRFIPRLLAARPEDLHDDTRDNLDPHKAWAVMMRNEKPGGHGERAVAVGILDMALWDAVAKIEQKPLYRVIAGRYNNGQADAKVYVYAAGGYYYPGKGLDQLRGEMQRYLDLGYNDVKIKIGGAPIAEDLARIEAILPMLPKNGKLAVDANGRFDLPTALEYGRRLNAYDLKWYEEPGDPLDYEIMKEVAQQSKIPCATGENLFSMQDGRNLIRYGGMEKERDYLQMDPALSYGLVEYLRTLKMLNENGWSNRRCIPHGGHQMALQIAAGMQLGGNESYPGVFQPFGGFADDVAVEDGCVAIPDAPGVGMELKAGLWEVLKSISN